MKYHWENVHKCDKVRSCHCLGKYVSLKRNKVRTQNFTEGKINTFIENTHCIFLSNHTVFLLQLRLQFALLRSQLSQFPSNGLPFRAKKHNLLLELFNSHKIQVHVTVHFCTVPENCDVKTGKTAKMNLFFAKLNETPVMSVKKVGKDIIKHKPHHISQHNPFEFLCIDTGSFLFIEYKYAFIFIPITGNMYMKNDGFIYSQYLNWPVQLQFNFRLIQPFVPAMEHVFNGTRFHMKGTTRNVLLIAHNCRGLLKISR